MTKLEAIVNVIFWTLLLVLLSGLFKIIGNLLGLGFVTDNATPFFAGIWFVFVAFAVAYGIFADSD